MIRTRYSAVAMLLHWTIAVLIVINLTLGFRMGYLKGLAQYDIFQLHKSVGITILLLSLLRLAWRLANRPPPEPASLQPWEKAGAAVVHWGFYIIMIGMPLSGWLLVSTSPLNIPTLLFHLVPWPHVPGTQSLAAGPKHAVNALSTATHLALAWGTLALLFLHISAALKHQIVDKDAVLGRMIPRVPQPKA